MSQQLPTLFAGSCGAALAARVAGALGWSVAASTSRRFPDGEVSVDIGESVRGRDVILIQPTAPPVNDNLIELLAFADACRRDAARGISAVVPYFGYARADRRGARRQPITARLVADLMQAAGIDQLVTVDIHSEAIEGFFRIPMVDLDATPLLCEALRERLEPDAVIVSPDLGRLRTALAIGLQLDRPVAALHKERLSGAEVQVHQLIGDVRGRACLLIDDMISTGRTIAAAAEALARAGARRTDTVAATHGVFSPGATAVLGDAGITNVIVTDTVPARDDWPPVRSVSVAPLLAEAIRRATGAPAAGPP